MHDTLMSALQPVQEEIIRELAALKCENHRAKEGIYKIFFLWKLYLTPITNANQSTKLEKHLQHCFREIGKQHTARYITEENKKVIYLMNSIKFKNKFSESTENVLGPEVPA